MVAVSEKPISSPSNQGCGSGYFSTASASTNKKRVNDR